MPVSREKERWIRHAGNALEAIFGVNDTTDFGDIHAIRELLQDAHEAYAFYSNSGSKDASESEYYKRMSNFWGNEFANKYPEKKKQVAGAIWDLYILKKYITKVEVELKFAVNNFTEDTAKEF